MIQWDNLWAIYNTEPMFEGRIHHNGRVVGEAGLRNCHRIKSAQINNKRRNGSSSSVDFALGSEWRHFRKTEPDGS
jgi:hypothetical protein